VISKRSLDYPAICANEESAISVNRHGIEIRRFFPYARFFAEVPHLARLNVEDIDTVVVHSDHITVRVRDKSVYRVIPEAHVRYSRETPSVKPVNTVILCACPNVAMAVLSKAVNDL